MLDRTGVSLAPAMLAVKVWVAEALPSVTDKVKASEAELVSSSMASSSGT